MVKKKKPQIVKDIQGYKFPFINFSTQKIISHTQMTIFHNCPFRWGLQYRDKIKLPNASMDLVFGKAIHEVIQNYLTVFYNESHRAADEIDIEGQLNTLIRQEYLKDMKKNDNLHFSTPDEINEYFLDGIEILRYFKKKVKGYFSKRGWWLIGVEIPTLHEPIPNVLFKGSLDIVLYHEPTNIIEIWDIKTSKFGWGKWQKKDDLKLSQIRLYKKFLSEQFGFPKQNIKTKYFILKRKLPEESDYIVKRIQEFSPPSGKIKEKQAFKLLEQFTTSAFNNITGDFSEEKFKKKVDKYNCQFCPYKDRDDLCDKNRPKGKWKSPFEIS